MRLIFASLLFGAALSAQTPGSAVTISAIDSATKLPVPGVLVMIPSAGNVSGKTANDGSMRFETVPPGNQRIRLTRQGYNDATATLRVKPGGESEQLTVALDPLGGISGVVVDEDDAPLAGVLVYIGISLRSTTDEKGRYELQDLPAAEYRIVLRLPYELRKKTLKVDDRGESLGYASMQYYPGVTDASLAEPINLPVGSLRTGLKIRLRRTRLAALQGRLLDGVNGRALRPSELELVAPGGSFEKSTVDERGEFSFDLLPPGHYSLEVSGARSVRDLVYVAPIDLPDAGARDIEIRVPPFPRLTATVKATDPDVQLAGRCDISIGVSSENRSIVKAGTSYDLGEVPPGMVRLSVRAENLHTAADPSRKFHIDSIRFGSQDGLGPSITVAEAGNPPIEITVTDQSGQVTGIVTGDDSAGLFVTARRAGSGPGAQDVRTMTRNDGSFTITDLVPDDYEVTAWSGNRSCFGGDCPCTAQAAKVTVANGQSSMVRLTACRF